MACFSAGYHFQASLDNCEEWTVLPVLCCCNSVFCFFSCPVIAPLSLLLSDLMGDSGEEETAGEGRSVRKQGEQGEQGEERREGGKQGPRGHQPQGQRGQSQPTGYGVSTMLPHLKIMFDHIILSLTVCISSFYLYELSQHVQRRMVWRWHQWTEVQIEVGGSKVAEVRGLKHNSEHQTLRWRLWIT